jgi:hypothetical protein
MSTCACCARGVGDTELLDPRLLGLRRHRCGRLASQLGCRCACRPRAEELATVTRFREINSWHTALDDGEGDGDRGQPVAVIASLPGVYRPCSSQGEAQFADKLLSAMRKEFGGHFPGFVPPVGAKREEGDDRRLTTKRG